MSEKTFRDLGAAAAITIFGLFFAGYGAATLPLGNFSRMGPGLFPMLVGIVIAVLGGGYAATLLLNGSDKGPATLEDLEPEQVQWRSLAVVVGGLALFSFVAPHFGLIPAIIALIVVMTLSNPKLGWRSAIGLTVFLSLVAYLVFIRALGLSFKLLEWPL